MPTLGAPLDFAKLEARNMQAHQLGAAPSSPVKGQLYYNTGDNTLYYYNGTVWIAASAAAGGPPTGAAGGDLSGTYPNPQIAAGVITDADVAIANKDGAVGTPSLRTLGSGAQQAAPGNDARFGSGGPPTGTAGGDLSGTYPNPQIAAGVITDVDVAAANKDGAVGTASLRTLGGGAAQAMPGNRTLDVITAPAADLNLNSKKITSLAAPTVGTDAANRAYVDGVAQGLDAKESVHLATTINMDLTGPETIDGIAATDQGRVLVKDQTNPAQNGIYRVNNAGAWTRDPDMDTWFDHVSAFVFVERGNTQADTGWVCTSDQGGTLGSTAITWTQFSGAGQIIAGTGLAKSGNTLDVGAGAGITVNADTVQVANNGITNAMIADGAVDLATADVTGILPTLKGGTGQSSAIQNLTRRKTMGNNPASTTWLITAATHGLAAGAGALIQVMDQVTGIVELPDIQQAANGDITITFGVAPPANSKYCTIVV